MKKRHIGLDFGTYQTKACIYDIENDLHEFFRFPTTGDFFIPSRVGLKKDGTLEYGPSSGEAVQEFFYFKIAAAEDEEFVTETFETLGNGTANTYDRAQFDPFTPEFLSALFITYTVLTIKEQQTQSNTSKKKGGFASRLFGASGSSTEDVVFSIQMGIPTEWSQKKNLRRKRKFENILLISDQLQQQFKTLDRFTKLTTDELLAAVQAILKQFVFNDTKDFDEELNARGLSVFPETAAGLTFIVKSKQLLPGYYSIMDIGGGSADISFFAVESGNYIKYLASESYIIAANNVYRQYADSDSNGAIHQAEKAIKVSLKSPSWQEDNKLVNALTSTRDGINKLAYKLFHRRVRHFRPNMTKHYEDQPILLYGGGSRLPGINGGRVLIHDNGNRSSINIPLTYLEKHPIHEYTSAINVLPADESWKVDLPVLVVALGLSYIKANSFADWFGEEEYQRQDGPIWERKNLNPHPYNEDCFIYDVLASKWNL